MVAILSNTEIFLVVGQYMHAEFERRQQDKEDGKGDWIETFAKVDDDQLFRGPFLFLRKAWRCYSSTINRHRALWYSREVHACMMHARAWSIDHTSHHFAACFEKILDSNFLFLSFSMVRESELPRRRKKNREPKPCIIHGMSSRLVFS